MQSPHMLYIYTHTHIQTYTLHYAMFHTDIHPVIQQHIPEECKPQLHHSKTVKTCTVYYGISLHH